MTRARSSRVVAITATAVLIAMGMLSGPVSAADSRDVKVGSAPLVGPDFANDGHLLPTPVSQGGTTMFTVVVQSNDNQTIANTNLAVSIAEGLVLVDFYDPDNGSDASTCSPVAGGLNCAFGNLAGFGERTIALVVDVPADFSTAATGLFTALMTTNNENGSNLQLFAASSDAFAVAPLTDNALQTFAGRGQAKHLQTAGVNAGNRLQTLIDFTADGDGDAISISEAATSGKYACPAGLTCQAEYSEVLFSRTDFDAPYLKWTIKALVPNTYTLAKGFLVHYTSDTQHDPIMFFKSKTVYCGTNLDAKLAADGQCIQTATLSKVDKATGFATLTIEAYFDHNGGSRF